MKDYDETIITGNICNIVKKRIFTKNKMVVTLATENYSCSINYLLSSIKHYEPGIMVLIYCIGWRNVLLTQFKTCYPNYYFKEIKMENYVKGDIIKLKVKIQRETYLEYTCGYIWIDADSIVLSSLDKLFDLIPKYNLICYYRPEENFYMKFAVGVIIFGKNVSDETEQKINLDFINKYYGNSLVTDGFHDWFYDQTSLYETWLSFVPTIKLYTLGENEHSIYDNVNTIIYSRRTDNKHKLHDILKSRGCIIANINFGQIKMAYT
jgi:hypothetical protein